MSPPLICVSVSISKIIVELRGFKGIQSGVWLGAVSPWLLCLSHWSWGRLITRATRHPNVLSWLQTTFKITACSRPKLWARKKLLLMSWPVKLNITDWGVTRCETSYRVNTGQFSALCNSAVSCSLFTHSRPILMSLHKGAATEVYSFIPCL